MKNFWFIFNKIDSKEMESMMMEKLEALHTRILRSVAYDPEIAKKGLEGALPVQGKTRKDVEQIVDRLELPPSKEK